MSDREADVVEAFVQLSRPTSGVDDVASLLTDLLACSLHLLDVLDAGVLLRDGSALVLAAASTPDPVLRRVLLAVADGPASVRYPVTSSVPDAAHAPAWPALAPAVLAHGSRNVHCVPMRWSEADLGTLVLLTRASGALDQTDLALARAMTDVAAVALVQSRAADATGRATAQLLTALESRAVIEQAKGVLSQQGGFGVDAAFSVLRRYARDHNRKLADVAADVVSRELAAALVVEHDVLRRRPGPRSR